MEMKTYSVEGSGIAPSICIIGAGFSGLLAGIKLKKELGISNFVIFDENHEVGGVWLRNTYPGCACDVQSHLYSYSFEKNPYWSENYAPREEILEYLIGVAKKYDLYRNIQFNTQIKTTTWDEKTNVWIVNTYNKDANAALDYNFQVVINSPGALRVPNIPVQFESFKGPMFHSSNWNHDIPLEGKVVAVVGSGASAVQLIPRVAKTAKILHSYQRNPPWVMPRTNFKIPKFIQWMFAYIPFLMLLFRWMLFWSFELFYAALISGTRTRSLSKWWGNRHRRRQLAGDEKLRKALKPNYQLGCNRVVVNNDFYPALSQPNAYVHTDRVLSVTDDTIVTEVGGPQKIDVLILATGFKVQEYFAPMLIFGKNHENILETWITSRPRGYLGMVCTSTPNMYGLLGPHTGLAHNSVLFMIECQVNYIIQIIGEMIRVDASVVELKEEAQEEEMKLLDIQMKKMVWGAETCSSWYHNAKGINTTLWPWSCIKYWRRTRRADFSKFHFNKNFDVVCVKNG